jgi:predicted GIY-YIG superfamily endonuclease
MRAWIYILECSDGSYYTGCTTNLSKRISEHKCGTIEGYTSKRLPVKLRWSQEFNEIRYAIMAERQIKGWSRKKKEALIKERFDLLHEFAQSKEMVDRLTRKKAYAKNSLRLRVVPSIDGTPLRSD